MNIETERIGLGGGCHWCTEAVFQSLRGISNVEQGWIRSTPPHDKFSEAVIVTYDPNEMSLATLIEIHLLTHSSTSSHKMRGKYRSAVYTFSEHQTALTTDILDGLQPAFEGELVTQVLRHESFKPSNEQFRNYYYKNPERPFCKVYIDPKLRVLLDRFSDVMRSSEGLGAFSKTANCSNATSRTR